MSPRAFAFLLLIPGFCSCAPARTVLLPGPPPGIQQETTRRADVPEARPEPPPSSAAPAPSPADDTKRYEEAIARTRDAIARKAWKTAIPAWTELEKGPYRRDALFHRGVLLQFAGELDGAKELYRRLADEVPPFEPAAANLIGILLLRGELAEAGAWVARLLPDPRSPPPGMLPELQANLAAVLVEAGRLEEAARLIDSLQASGFDSPSLTWNLAVLAYRNGDPAAAETRAAKLPAETASLFPVAASRVAWNRDGEKIPAVDAVPAAERRLSFLARNLRAFRAYRNGEPGAAEAVLRDADAGATPPELLTNLGILAAEQGKWKAAREAFEEAIRRDPDLAAGWRNLGIYLEIFAGDPTGAGECYERYGMHRGVDREEVSKWAEWVGRSQPSSP